MNEETIGVGRAYYTFPLLLAVVKAAFRYPDLRKEFLAALRDEVAAFSEEWKTRQYLRTAFAEAVYDIESMDTAPRKT